MYLVGDSEQHTPQEMMQGSYFQRIWQFLLSIREKSQTENLQTS